MLFSFYPQGSGIFFWKPSTKKKQNCLVHWPIVSQKLLKDFLAVAGREPTKTSHGKISVEWDWNHGLVSDARNSSHNVGRNSDVPCEFCPMKVGGMSWTYDSNDEIPPAKIDNLWMKKHKVSKTFTKCTDYILTWDPQQSNFHLAPYNTRIENGNGW